jgi:O-antigen/teichoic acid export membrane protein
MGYNLIKYNKLAVPRISSQKALYWLKLSSITGIAQIIVQAVGFVSGILIIRLLPVEEYALYTIANTMLGTMAVLSDGGISTGVIALGGKVWQDKQQLGAVLATGMDLRRKFAVFSLIVSLPVSAYLLMHNGATWLKTLLITASLIPAFYAALSDNLLQIPVKLHQAIKPLQRNQVEVSIGRLILTGLTLFAFPWAFVAIIASGIPRVWGNFKLRKIAENFAEKEAKVDAGERKEIVKVVKRVLPGAIYYCLSGQITLWLISIFGNTTSVAQLGALGRISVLLTLVSTVFATMIVPRFAKLPDVKSVLIRRAFFSLVFVSVICWMIVCCCYIFSNQILWVIGQKYYGLNIELLLCITASAISEIAAYAFGLLNCKGWILNPVISISISIISVIVGVMLFDIASLKGVLYYKIFLAIIQLVLNNSYLFFRLNQKNMQTRLL